jgi:hypothetical protein
LLRRVGAKPAGAKKGGDRGIPPRAPRLTATVAPRVGATLTRAMVGGRETNPSQAAVGRQRKSGFLQGKDRRWRCYSGRFMIVCRFKMCARRSRRRPAGASPAHVNAPRSRRASASLRPRVLWPRVLREPRAPRGAPRSVNRDCAGRNATSVKVLSPENCIDLRGGRAVILPRRQQQRSRAKPHSQYGCARAADAAGVQVHGMYKRSTSEPGRSADDGARLKPAHQTAGQGVAAKSTVHVAAEVRSRRSSEEVG